MTAGPKLSEFTDRCDTKLKGLGRNELASADGYRKGI
jgi:hypothetical protein